MKKILPKNILYMLLFLLILFMGLLATFIYIAFSWVVAIGIWQDNNTLEVYHRISTEYVRVQNERVSDYEVIFGTCENESKSQAIAPDEQYIAIVYERHCGESAAHTTHVSIFEFEREYGDRHGNVLQVFGNNDENSIGITWIDGHTLRIVHEISSEKIIQQKEKQFVVNVIYERFEH